MDVGVILFVGGVVAAAVISGISTLRTRRAFEAERRRALAEAQGEVQRQVSAMADDMLTLSDQLAVTADVDSEVTALFARASTTYQEAQDHLERSRSAAELEHVSDELDRARWQLESARAMAERRELPAPPGTAVACFFDPTHGAGTEHAAIDTSAGRREVRVCSYCATKLRSGRSPEPRMIEVGGRRVPAAKAPRAYGGGGMEWLDDFSVVFDQMRRPYGWGGYGPRPYARGRGRARR